LHPPGKVAIGIVFFYLTDVMFWHKIDLKIATIRLLEATLEIAAGSTMLATILAPPFNKMFGSTG